MKRSGTVAALPPAAHLHVLGATPKRLNIVLILADDMGYSDLGGIAFKVTDLRDDKGQVGRVVDPAGDRGLQFRDWTPWEISLAEVAAWATRRWPAAPARSTGASLASDRAA